MHPLFRLTISLGPFFVGAQMSRAGAASNVPLAGGYSSFPDMQIPEVCRGIPVNGSLFPEVVGTYQHSQGEAIVRARRSRRLESRGKKHAWLNFTRM